MARISKDSSIGSSVSIALKTKQERTEAPRAAKPAAIVSICTVTYCRRPLLKLLEQCVLKQDFPLEHVEWVILDDTPEKAEGNIFDAAKQAGVRVKHILLNHKLKLGAKRNLSHEHCTGEYIAYMDDDDYYPPTRISHAVASLQSSDCLIAGCSELPMMLLPEKSTWMTHTFDTDHATANTLAFHRDYLDDHAYDPEATEAEEARFLENFTAPMVQLEPLKTITCVGHSRNTVDKRRFITSTQGKGISRVYVPKGQFVPEQYLAEYSNALEQIESQYKHGVVSGATTPITNTKEAEVADKPIRTHNIAVITPYYQEDPAILLRCHESVKQQSVNCTHFLIADGPILGEIDEWDCRHIKLGGSGHSDNGNTPRSIGALCAMNEGFSCIAYLDADNWYLPDHLESAIKIQQETNCEIVFTGREIAFPDGELLQQLDEEDLNRSHADTSSIIVFAPAFRSLTLWAQMPKELGPYCDRVAFSYLTSHFKCAWTDQCSVVFETWYWGHFTAAGRLAPANAKFLPARSVDEWRKVSERFRERSHTPFMPLSLPESPRKTRINLISILGPIGCGAYTLQRSLCHHITYFGLPPNNFLYRWQQAFGDDCDTRHESEIILAKFSRLSDAKALSNDWRCDALVDVKLALTPERSFTALEAYFRLVQATMPERSRSFSRLNGVANLVERSSSASYASSLLFEMLPMHRTLLVLANPLKQIASLFQLQRLQRLDSHSEPSSLHDLCLQYIDGLLQPLEACPSQQLLIVRQEVYDLDPDKSLHHIIGWLGIDTPEWPEGLKRKIETVDVVNQVYYDELMEIKKQVDQEISLTTASTGLDILNDLSDIDQSLEKMSPHQEEATWISESEDLYITNLFLPLINFFDVGELPRSLDLVASASTPTLPTTTALASAASPLALEKRVLHLCELLQQRLSEPIGHLCLEGETPS